MRQSQLSPRRDESGPRRRGARRHWVGLDLESLQRDADAVVKKKHHGNPWRWKRSRDRQISAPPRPTLLQRSSAVFVGRARKSWGCRGT